MHRVASRASGMLLLLIFVFYIILMFSLGLLRMAMAATPSRVGSIRNKFPMFPALSWLKAISLFKYLCSKQILVLGSPVQSGFSSIFGKTGTETGPRFLKFSKTETGTDVNRSIADFLRIFAVLQPVSTGLFPKRK
jgi:hypothetical protein